jgi:hypothetical protein
MGVPKQTSPSKPPVKKTPAQLELEKYKQEQAERDARQAQRQAQKDTNQDLEVARLHKMGRAIAMVMEFQTKVSARGRS